MVVSLRSLAGPTLAASLLLASPVALAQDQASDDYKLWDQFTHYVLVAQPSQALALGEELLALPNDRLLAAIEMDRHTVPGDLEQWLQNPEFGDLGERFDTKYQAALTERSRDADQIAMDLAKLNGSQREYLNAVERLKVTGQFAAPAYLEALQHGESSDHPRIIRAMTEVGDELVYPLSVALPHLDAATAGKIALVLGQIGYPEALPYLKEVMESGGANADLKNSCASAYDRIAANWEVPANASASQLHLILGEIKYDLGTRGDALTGMDEANDVGIVWRYNADAGLVMIPVPRAVYADVLAMQNARSSMRLDNESAEALTLHLASNLRRENNLNSQQDISYKLPNPASFYLLQAGPDQQKTVLARALDDNDPALALDAIEAMAQTVGDVVLLGANDARQPLLEALYYSDRRVRYTAAITLANAAPAEDFPGAFSVVPVLGQAVRQSETLTAMVVMPNGESDAMVAAMEDVDFAAAGGSNVDLASQEANAVFPGVDLIVYSGNLSDFRAAYAASRADGMLAVAPILALVDGDVATAIGLEFPDVVTAAPLGEGDAELDRLERLAAQTIAQYGGDPIGGDEALGYAESALSLLEGIADHPSIYDASDVLAIMVEALDDDRSTVATGAGEVLALLPSAEAQQGLAAAAMSRRGAVQVSLLGSLAESAMDHGNQLDTETIDQLVELTNTAGGDTALAAARALGALTDRPTSNTTNTILGG